jgi:XTP/dITP diphosphohydrolase
MMQLVAATRNTGKLREIRALFAGHDIRVVSAGDFPGCPEVIEDGATFAANAAKKAREAAAFTGHLTLADDSGLEVDILDGRPGIHSARFAGEDAGDAENTKKLLQELAGVPAEQRGAAFRCVMALCRPDGFCRLFSGRLEGVILEERRGREGFGYDPVFFVPDYGKTLAELPLETKNRISHRGRALARLLEFFKTSGRDCI